MASLLDILEGNLNEITGKTSALNMYNPERYSRGERWLSEDEETIPEDKVETWGDALSNVGSSVGANTRYLVNSLNAAVEGPGAMRRLGQARLDSMDRASENQRMLEEMTRDSEPMQYDVPNRPEGYASPEEMQAAKELEDIKIQERNSRTNANLALLKDKINAGQIISLIGDELSYQDRDKRAGSYSKSLPPIREYVSDRMVQEALARQDIDAKTKTADAAMLKSEADMEQAKGLRGYYEAGAKKNPNLEAIADVYGKASVISKEPLSEVRNLMKMLGLETVEEETPEVLPVEEKEGMSGWAKAGIGGTSAVLTALLIRSGMSKNQAKKLAEKAISEGKKLKAVIPAVTRKGTPNLKKEISDLQGGFDKLRAKGKITEDFPKVAKNKKSFKSNQRGATSRWTTDISPLPDFDSLTKEELLELIKKNVKGF